MAKRRTRSLIADLARYSEAISENAFAAIKTVYLILEDHAFIADTYGDEPTALEQLEDQYFRVLKGYVKLPTLVAIYRAFPEEDSWAEYKYDLKAMEILWQEKRNAEKEPVQRKPVERVSRKEFDETTRELETTQETLKRTVELAESKDATIARLEQQVRDLNSENQRLRGRIEELERVLEMQMSE